MKRNRTENPFELIRNYWETDRDTTENLAMVGFLASDILKIDSEEDYQEVERRLMTLDKQERPAGMIALTFNDCLRLCDMLERVRKSKGYEEYIVND